MLSKYGDLFSPDGLPLPPDDEIEEADIVKEPYEGSE